MSRNIFTSEFRGIRIIVPQIVLDRRKIEVLLLDTVTAWEKLVTVLRGTLVEVYTVVKDLAFFLI